MPRQGTAPSVERNPAGSIKTTQEKRSRKSRLQLLNPISSPSSRPSAFFSSRFDCRVKSSKSTTRVLRWRDPSVPARPGHDPGICRPHCSGFTWFEEVEHVPGGKWGGNPRGSGLTPGRGELCPSGSSRFQAGTGVTTSLSLVYLLPLKQMVKIPSIWDLQAKKNNICLFLSCLTQGKAPQALLASLHCLHSGVFGVFPLMCQPQRSETSQRRPTSRTSRPATSPLAALSPAESPASRWR